MWTPYLWVLLSLCTIGHAQEEDKANVTSQLNLPLRTLGGIQFWTDYRNRAGHRLQQHAVTGHWRLLDDRDVRAAWGTKQQCLSKLENAKPADQQTQDRHVIVLLHGLMRTNRSMKPFEVALKDADFDHTVRFSYASARRSIDDHAKALQQLLEDWPPTTQFSFVGHSMGNIVVRRMLGELQVTDTHKIIPRCESMVMLGPPNQGAAIARRLAPTGLYGLITGKGGMQLGPKWHRFAKQLATPSFPFAIIAGDVSANRVQNPLIKSGNDLVVTLDEAKLEGCERFEVVPVMHTFLMNDATVHKVAIDFLRENVSRPDRANAANAGASDGTHE